MTLLSLLSVGVLFGLRIGLNAMERTNDRLMTNRRVLGVERVLDAADRRLHAGHGRLRHDSRRRRLRGFRFFKASRRRCASSRPYSLNEGGAWLSAHSRVSGDPGRKGRGVRLIVNELVVHRSAVGRQLVRRCHPDIPGIGRMMIFRPGGDRTRLVRPRGQTGAVASSSIKKSSSCRNPICGSEHGLRRSAPAAHPDRDEAAQSRSGAA